MSASHRSIAATSELQLDAHPNFLLAARDLYSANVRWLAPARGVERVGREAVIRHLLREASGMHDPEFTSLRRNGAERQMIDEFAVRFVYAGEGIENAPAKAGDFVELKRVRILELVGGKVATETCIENWTVLLPKAAT
ncbi:MAG: hypothetical protein ACREV5_08730 [Steroidobacter sp.]